MSREYSEADYRPRPNPRGSRPRTKRRPSHEDATTGTVITVDRGRYRVTPDGRPGVIVVCVRAADLRRTAIVPGDRVGIVGDTSGREGTLARLVTLHERKTLLRRSADDGDPQERVLVANADTVVVVVAAADPEPRTRLIDRTLAAAFDARMHAVVAVTKTDLASPASLREHYSSVDVDVIGLDRATDGGPPRPDPTPLWPVLDGHTSVFVGHSGVGKSTLVNAVVPGLERATGHVNEVTGRGRHTSSSALMVPLPPPHEGWVIDTPGIRSFGLAHVTPDTLLQAFDDLAPAAADCPKGCTHGWDSPGCALDAWVAEGKAGPHGAARLESFRRLAAGISS